MKRFVCSICGFVYDEANGLPDAGLKPGTLWQDVPASWICPVCGADKQAFYEVSSEKKAVQPMAPIEDAGDMTNLEMSALCSNLARACAKQFSHQDAELYQQLADWYLAASAPLEDSPLEAELTHDVDALYPQANQLAKEAEDRGALRILLWSEKVTRMHASLLSRMEESKGDMMRDTNVFVCDACGFIFVGDSAPDICPVCKVPAFKFNRIERGA